MLRFSEDPEARFFRVKGVALAAVAGLTDFTGSGAPKQLEAIDERAG